VSDATWSSERRTARLNLVPWSSGYSYQWARLLANPEVVRFISDGVPYTHQEALRNSERSERLWKDYGFGPWAAIEQETGRWIGRVGLNRLEDWPEPDRWEVGWELDPEFWGRGLATEAGQEAVRFGFEAIGLRRIISVTRADHLASRRVMEKVGLMLQSEVLFRDVSCVWYAIDAPAAAPSN
jgi:RimJ/RimL family protein N-acetyltransferase